MLSSGATGIRTQPHGPPLPALLAAGALLAALLLLALSLPARAQTWADGPGWNLSATANVLEPLTGGALQHLYFGAVIPGDSIIVPAVTAGVPNESAGKWEIAFNAGITSVTVAFDLPDSMVHTVEPSARMPLSWNGGDYGGLCEVQPGGSCVNVTAINPDLYRFGSSAGYTYALTQRANTRKVYVYLGGKALALGPDLLAGDYKATVTLHFYTTVR